MAFTSKSERLINFGPAPYNFSQRQSPEHLPAHKEYEKQTANVPFNSSSIREICEETIQAKDFNPGPGIYEPVSGFDAIRKRKDSILQSILSKIQASKAPFSSQVNRFDDLSSKKSATRQLGPGQYNHIDSWNKGKKEHYQRSKSQMKAQLNTSELDGSIQHITPPSIPSGDFRFGYKVDETGHNIISLKSLFKSKGRDENSE